MDENVILELKDVFFTNDEYLVLENINIKIYKNGYTVVIGKSGAGKTSLLKLLAGIYFPDGGKSYFYSKDSDEMRNKDFMSLRKRMGFVFQDSALISNLSIKENLLLPLNYHAYGVNVLEKEKMVSALLEKISLLESLDERPAQLSLGEQKLVSIARGIILKPEILFLDEPLAYLDESNCRKMIKLIRDYYLENDATIIAVTNSKSFIIDVADRIVLVDNKTIAFDEKIKKIKDSDPAILAELIKDMIINI
jgi:phospholipid/cholesterol/gamma-HCH transport system ATP-binding protein